MTNKEENKKQDEMALDALLAAAFRLDLSEEITDEQVEKFFTQTIWLSQEDKKTVNSWGSDLVKKLLQNKKNDVERHQENFEVSEELEQEIFAMNRDKDGNDIDEETRRKIDEERKKALEEEENKDKKQDDES